MKTILVDAVGTLIDEKVNIFQEMYELLETYPNKKIILTCVDDEQIKELNFDKLPYEYYTTKHNPNKTDPTYYTQMLGHFNFTPNDVIYFEHGAEAVKNAQLAGINTYFYDEEKKDLISLKQFIDNNL